MDYLLYQDHPCVCRNFRASSSLTFWIPGSHLPGQEHYIEVEEFADCHGITHAWAGTFSILFDIFLCFPFYSNLPSLYFLFLSFLCNLERILLTHFQYIPLDLLSQYLGSFLPLLCLLGKIHCLNFTYLSFTLHIFTDIPTSPSFHWPYRCFFCFSK